MHPLTAALYGLADSLTRSPSPGPTPGATPTSGSDLFQISSDCSTEWCRFVLARTGSRWFAEGSYLLVVKPLRILLFIALAVLVRRLACRTLDRLVRTTANGSVPAILRPLKERATNPPPPDAIPERRRQRAEAIGSVLRSLATVTIYGIAGLMVLRELGFDIAPLLASAGILGLALGFGAQTLVKDLIAGLFMLLEDQYGVGDFVDLGEASGTIEAVGLRTTTLRDSHGVTWYIRNGAINRVGNRSQGWAVVIVDIPVKLVDVEEAAAVLHDAGTRMASDPRWAAELIDGPEVLGVEQITADGAVLRAQGKSRSEAQWRVGREMRRRFTEALAAAHVDQPAGTANGAQVAMIPAAPGNTAAGPTGAVTEEDPSGGTGGIRPSGMDGSSSGGSGGGTGTGGGPGSGAGGGPGSSAGSGTAGGQGDERTG